MVFAKKDWKSKENYDRFRCDKQWETWELVHHLVLQELEEHDISAKGLQKSRTLDETDLDADYILEWMRRMCVISTLCRWKIGCDGGSLASNWQECSAILPIRGIQGTMRYADVTLGCNAPVNN